MPDASHDERLQKALERARQLLANEDYGRAIELCQKILAAYPGQGEAQAFLSEAQGKANARLVEDIFAYAERLVQAADYDLAVEQIEKIFVFDPDHARAKARIAQIEAMKSGAAPDDDALPDPSDLLKDAASQPFGIDSDDPFALGDDAPAPFPPVAPPPQPPPRPAKTFEVDDDMSSAIVTSDRMHEAVDEFAARVSDDAKTDIVVDEPEEDFGFGEPSLGSMQEEAPPATEEDDSTFALADEPPPSGFETPEPEPAALLDAHEGPPAGGASAEDAARIQELLKKGQSYFERGQCQLAIDTWYQILLMDERHEAALKSIAKAKDELAMQGKRVQLDLPEQVLAAEEAPLEGVADDAIAALVEQAQALLAAEKYAEAAKKCEHIISIAPGHMEANRIIHDANLKIKAQERAEAAKQAAAPSAAAPSGPSASPFKGTQIAAASSGNKAVVMIAGGAAALVLVGLGIYFVVARFGKPDAPPPEPPASAAKAEPQPQAAPPAEPQPAVVETPPSEEELLAARIKHADELFAQAQKLFAEKQYPEAVSTVRESLTQNPANLDAMDFKSKAELALQAFKEETERHAAARASYRDGNYEDALRHLYRMTEPRFYSAALQEAAAKGYYTLTVDPKTIERYIQNAWFSAGVAALQGANTEAAIKAFNDYLMLRPDDAQARKHLEVAHRYHNRPKDENYRQYVEFLKVRGWDD